MLLNVAPRTARGSKLSIGTRGSANELTLGGPTVINYDPEAADTQTVDLLDDPPFQDAGTGGPGNMALTLALDEVSKEYQMLRDSYTADDADSTEVFNWYKGTKKSIRNNDADRCQVAAGVATFTVNALPWGTATTKGTIAKGHFVQYTGDSALYRIDGLAGDFDYDDNSKWKLAVTPMNGATADHADEAFRIVLPQIVHENWIGRVIMAGGSGADASNTVIQGNVTIAPENVLPAPVPIPYA